MYVNTDDIKKLVDNALEATDIYPVTADLAANYGILRGYLYAIQNILTKDENND